MDDLYSRILDQQVNNLIQSAEDKAEEVKEEVVVEQVKPVVEKKNIYARDQSKLRDVVEYQPENVQEYFGIEPEKPKAKKVVEQKARKPQTARDRLDEVSINEVSKAISFITKNDRHDEVTTVTPDLILDEKVNTLQKQIYQISTSISSLKEATLVSGIGQGGDGQTPGSGVVLLRDLDDVDLGNLNDGDSLIWDSVSGNFVPGAGGGGGGAVDRLIPGHGIDLNPAGGIGNVEIILDANLNDLADVIGTPTNGDLLVYNGTNWSIGHMNTSQLDLTNPTRLAGNRSVYNRLTPGSYKTQEDANILFASEINDLISRVDEVQGNTKPGHYLGQLDCSDAANEPSDDDTAGYDPGDYFIHTGPDGQLWGVGQNITDGNSIIWNGVDWEVVSSSNTLVSLGDTNINNAINGQFLVYDEAGERWENESVNIPLVTTGDTAPNLGSEKEGDIFYNEDTKELFVYTTIWEKVAGGGGGVTISADAPDPSIANEGDLWVETDNWTIAVFDGFNWVGLTNSGLVSGTDPADIVTNDVLDGTVQSLTTVININKQSADAGLLALDSTHLRMTPQGPLTGPLTLSDDEITAAKQATTKEFVDNKFQKLHPSKPFTNSLSFRKGDDKIGNQLKISLNGGTDYSSNIYAMNGGQLRFRSSHSNTEGDHVGSHIILDPKDGAPETKIYHVVEPTSPKMAANKEYVDGLFSSAGVPVGAIMVWLNNDPPAGWFNLTGDTFDITEYPLLHQYLSVTQSYTDGVLPNWKGRFPGQHGNHLTGTLGTFLEYTTGSPHFGPIESTVSIPNGNTRSFSAAGGTNAYSDGKNRVVIDRGWDPSTRPPTVVVHYIIKHD